MNQKAKVLRTLKLHDQVCASVFYQNYMPTARNRIAELRAEGYQIESRRCENPAHHHGGGLVEYHLAGEPA